LEAVLTDYTSIAGAEKAAILEQVYTEYMNGNENETTTLLYQKLLITSGNPAATSGQYCFCQA